MAGFGESSFLTQSGQASWSVRGRTEALSSPRPHSPPSGRNHSDPDFTFEEGGLEGTFQGPTLSDGCQVGRDSLSPRLSYPPPCVIL